MVKIPKMWIASIGLLLVVSVSRSYGQELQLPRTLPDLVAEADVIAIADLTHARSRWNQRGNLIVTDYSFHVVHQLLGKSLNSQFVVTQAGGTLGQETQEISDETPLSVGTRYLIFLSPGRKKQFSPFVGAGQGVYQLFSDGTVVSMGPDKSRLQRQEFLDKLEQLISARGSTPPSQPFGPILPASRTYPAKSYRPASSTPPVAPLTQAPAQPTSPSAPTSPRKMPTVNATVSTFGSSGNLVPDYVYGNRISPPAVINAFPHDWVWHPYEEYQMSKWNQYGGDVFEVLANPTGDWAWGNGRFDLAGWPSNDQMIAQFGVGWSPDELGVTFTNTFGTSIILEADIALNPAFCWTLDDASGTDSKSGCQGFKQTMLHELGHAWGLLHPWETQDVWWDSVMNDSPQAYRFPELFADDTNAVRSAFSGPAIHDALISLYTTSLDTTTGFQEPIYTPTQTMPIDVYRGESFPRTALIAFEIENLGTDTIENPQVDFYLSQQRLNWNAYTYLTSAFYSGSIPPFTTANVYPTLLAVPDSTPTGIYFLATYLREQDANDSNNSAWSDADRTISVFNRPSTLYPTVNWQYSEPGSIGPQGTWDFYVVVQAGTIYDFSLCNMDGGSATFDTTLSISYDNIPVGFNDDYCGTSSFLALVAPFSGTMSLTVGSYENLSQGTFQLAYRVFEDELFSNGFEVSN